MVNVDESVRKNQIWLYVLFSMVAAVIILVAGNIKLSSELLLGPGSAETLGQEVDRLFDQFLSGINNFRITADTAVFLSWAAITVLVILLTEVLISMMGSIVSTTKVSLFYVKPDNYSITTWLLALTKRIGRLILVVSLLVGYVLMLLNYIVPYSMFTYQYAFTSEGFPSNIIITAVNLLFLSAFILGFILLIRVEVRRVLDD